MHGRTKQCGCWVLILCYVLSSGIAFAAPDPSDTIEHEYQSARQCYYELINDPLRQKQREHWEDCTRRFSQVESKYPRSARAADALFSTGKLYEQLFQASKNREDLKEAARTYQAMAKRYDKSRLADDALYRAGVIYWNGFRDKERAREAMGKVLKWHGDGDMAPVATRFIARLDAVKGAAPIDALLLITPVPVVIASRDATPTATTPPVTAPATPPPPRCHIAIDPGHGGKDPGTTGHRGSLEKAVTLAISKRVARVLKKQLACDVSLTRAKDQFVSLDERNIIANRQKSDLFISIHANAAPSPSAHGVQTYYLNNASDDAAQRLAARENTMAGKSLSEVEHIVNTMLQNAFTEESRRLADTVHRALITRLQGKYTEIQDQKVRSALFYVLVGAKSPSILVETSFLSNPREEVRLMNATYQETIAQGIADGVQQFLRTRRSDSTL